jgi:hypothetical protein
MMIAVLTLPLLVVAIAAAYALWHARHSRGQLRVRQFVLLFVILYVVLIPPVALAGWLVFRWRNPTDDWDDIVLFGIEVGLVLATPCVGVAVWLIASRVEKRRRARYPNACLTCGYDLTGVPSTVCPECGSVLEGM